ncbi:unnamed protein product [Moneuplotes crassus]|uniref:Uncharacterized protein n=1 Tax=Euplotes crassus TaxID=5936 RepID=A0AAD1XX60_EUPCR|nr:unnamed protein product [Moneuplotes crassus]
MNPFANKSSFKGANISGNKFGISRMNTLSKNDNKSPFLGHKMRGGVPKFTNVTPMKISENLANIDCIMEDDEPGLSQEKSSEQKQEEIASEDQIFDGEDLPQINDYDPKDMIPNDFSDGIEPRFAEEKYRESSDFTPYLPVDELDYIVPKGMIDDFKANLKAYCEQDEHPHEIIEHEEVFL